MQNQGRVLKKKKTQISNSQGKLAFILKPHFAELSTQIESWKAGSRHTQRLFSEKYLFGEAKIA